MEKIILASGSPRRRELMELAGYKFDVIVSDADENTDKTNPEDIVKDLSMLKAQAVEEELKVKTDNSFFVIGADTIVYSDGKVLGKPKDEEDAFNMIKGLSGNIHQVYTGVTIISKEVTKSFAVKTDVKVYPMTDEQIRAYIATGEPMDKAGAYGIQGKFAVYVEKIDGDYNNVVGLPISRLRVELENLL